MLQVILCQYCARYKVFFLFFLSIFSTIYLYIYKKIALHKQAVSLFRGKNKKLSQSKASV